jgi:hypothetical protein
MPSTTTIASRGLVGWSWVLVEKRPPSLVIDAQMQT